MIGSKGRDRGRGRGSEGEIESGRNQFDERNVLIQEDSTKVNENFKKNK